MPESQSALLNWEGCQRKKRNCKDEWEKGQKLQSKDYLLFNMDFMCWTCKAKYIVPLLNDYNGSVLCSVLIRRAVSLLLRVAKRLNVNCAQAASHRFMGSSRSSNLSLIMPFHRWSDVMEPLLIHNQLMPKKKKKNLFSCLCEGITTEHMFIITIQICAYLVFMVLLMCLSM